MALKKSTIDIFQMVKCVKRGTIMTNSETEALSPDVIAPIQGGDHTTTSDTQAPFQCGKGIAINNTIITYMEVEYVEPTPEDENVKGC
jgi:hypothetical protein